MFDSFAPVGAGGGIAAEGRMTITHSIISNNQVWYPGGGINAAGELTIINSTISGNTSDYGGGLAHWNNGSTTKIKNTTVTDNTARKGGGGLFTWLQPPDRVRLHSLGWFASVFCRGTVCVVLLGFAGRGTWPSNSRPLGVSGSLVG